MSTVTIDQQFLMNMMTQLTTLTNKMNEMDTTMKNEHLKDKEMFKGILDEKQTTINDLKQEKDTLAGQVTNLNDQVTSKDGEISQLKIDKLNKDIEIKDLQLDNHNKDEQISNLKDDIEEKEEQISNLQDENDDKDEQISNLQDEINDKNHSIVSVNNKVERMYNFIKENTIIVSDKGNYDVVNIISNQLSYDQKKYALDITKRALEEYDDKGEAANYIRERFDSIYGKYWDCIITFKDHGGYDGYHKSYYFIAFEMGEYLVRIKRTSF